MTIRYSPDISNVFDNLEMSRMPDIETLRERGCNVLGTAFWRLTNERESLDFYGCVQGDKVELRLYAGKFDQQPICLGDDKLWERRTTMLPVVSYLIRSALYDGAIKVLRENGKFGSRCINALEKAKNLREAFIAMPPHEQVVHRVVNTDSLQVYRVKEGNVGGDEYCSYERRVPEGKKPMEYFCVLLPLYLADEKCGNPEGVAVTLLGTHMKWLTPRE